MLETCVAPADHVRVRQAAIWASRHRVLARVCAAAAESRIDLLVFKGAHLAYQLYPDPVDRPCADVDLFVRPAHRPRLLEMLQGLGFRQCASNIGDLALGQATYELPRVPGSVLDVHSRLVTPFGIARRFAFEDLWARSTPFAAFPGARVPSLLDALQIALVHRHVHHPGEHADEWIRDEYLLLEALSADDLRRFGAWIADGTIPVGSSGIEARAGLTRHLRDARYVPPRLAARVVAAHLFPPAAYMRETYAPASRLPLPLLYGLRILRGVTRVVTAPSAR
jgi:hypothetical protein